MSRGGLHLFCGLMASGKSTRARAIAAEHGAILMSEDALLHGLWPGEIETLDDYRVRSERLATTLWPHVADLLRRGVPVVLDFPGATRGQRRRYRNLISRAECDHVLHHVATPRETCRARLEARNASGAHPFAPTLEAFDLFATFFEPPGDDEGFTIRRWSGDES